MNEQNTKIKLTKEEFESMYEIESPINQEPEEIPTKTEWELTKEEGDNALAESINWEDET